MGAPYLRMARVHVVDCGSRSSTALSLGFGMVFWALLAAVGTVVLCVTAAPPPTTQCSYPPYVDIRTVPADLTTPPMVQGAVPGPGRRVLATNPNWDPASYAYFALYLPGEWSPVGPPLPVLVELAGNGPWYDQFNDSSSGRPEGSNLGFGITGGSGAIWVSMPMLTADGLYGQTYWWGGPSVHLAGTPPMSTPTTFSANTTNLTATVDYIISTVKHVISTYNGDASRVVISGFSRGAIGVNYLGLFNDAIASLWSASIAYTHYDGQPEDAQRPYPDPAPPASYQRLARLGSRPQYIVCENNVSLEMTQPYIAASGLSINATFGSTGFCNHNDAWVLRPSPARDAIRAWWARVVA